MKQKKRQLLNLVTVFCVVKTYVRYFASLGIKVEYYDLCMIILKCKDIIY